MCVNTPMTPAERRGRRLSVHPCLTIEGALRLVVLWTSLGKVAWWRIEEGVVNVYWSGNVVRRKR